MSEYITTYTGKHFKPTEPDPELFDIADIAHALSLICRGNGHVKTFWSVGEHCICCAKEAKARGLSDRMVLACLLHDASECYMSDVPSPFKKELPGYNEREERMLSMIYEKFLGSDLTPEEKMQLNAIDKAMLWYDLTFLLGEKQESEAPELHIDLKYEVRAFGEVEPHRSVGRRTAGGRLQIALQLGTAGVEHLSPWYKGHLAVRRNAVEIEVAPPQVSAVRRLPRHRAAPGGQVAQQRPRPALVRIHLLRLLLEPMCLWYTVCH